jgi:putative transcriptional regulator
VPEHHVPADALVAYAAGSSTSGEELLVACHLSVCPSCRSAVAAAEALGELLLDRAPPALAPERTEDLLASLLDRLDAPVPAPAPLPRCGVFPAPLVRRMGALDTIPWRALGFGVRGAHVDTDDGPRVFLLDFPPGFRIPTHDHRGTERALVLRGAFSDGRDRFGPGDVSWSDDPGHDVRIAPDARCTTLFVNDGAADVGPLTRLVDWWITRH